MLAASHLSEGCWCRVDTTDRSEHEPGTRSVGNAGAELPNLGSLQDWLAFLPSRALQTAPCLSEKQFCKMAGKISCVLPCRVGV